MELPIILSVVVVVIIFAVEMHKNAIKRNPTCKIKSMQMKIFSVFLFCIHKQNVKVFIATIKLQSMRIVNIHKNNKIPSRIKIKNTKQTERECMI